MKKMEEVVKHKQMMEGQIKKQNDRDTDHRNLINNLNDKIYDRGLRYANQVGNNDPFYVKNDYEFNKRVSEMKEKEKIAIKNDQSLVQERLRDVRIYY